MVFEFDKLTTEDYDKFTGKTFCMSRKSLMNERFTLAFYSDDFLGSSESHIDVFIKSGDCVEVIDTEEFQERYNDFLFGSLVGDRELPLGDTVKVLVRRMSNNILDEAKFGYDCISYYICDDVVDGVLFKCLSLSGFLAANNIVGRDVPEVIEGINSCKRAGQPIKNKYITILKESLK